MTTDQGRLLLLLASRDLQTAAQLASQARQSPAETLRQLAQLVTQGFLVVVTGTAGAVYHLQPKHRRADTTDLEQRVLVVENELFLRELIVRLLEDEHYVVIATQAPVDAVALLDHVAFDLVLTDSLVHSPAAMLLARGDILRAATGTPVALFSAHRVDLSSVREAGFAGVLAKPFDVENFVAWVRGLLAERLTDSGAEG